MSAGPPRARGPRARTGELILRRLGDETLVYDPTRHVAHCLNRAASVVFDHCDGRASPEELVRRLEHRLGAPTEAVTGDIVALALRQLGEAGLLENPRVLLERDLGARRSRRAALRRLGGAALLPVVLSVLAPTPADAQTCIPRGGSCASSQQCCPNSPCCRRIGNRPPQCSPGGGNCVP